MSFVGARALFRIRDKKGIENQIVDDISRLTIEDELKEKGDMIEEL